jgi:hypothetical protein
VRKVICIPIAQNTLNKSSLEKLKCRPSRVQILVACPPSQPAPQHDFAKYPFTSNKVNDDDGGTWSDDIQDVLVDNEADKDLCGFLSMVGSLKE